MINRDLCRKCWVENQVRFFADPEWFPVAWYCLKLFNKEQNTHEFIGRGDTPPAGCPKAFEHALSESTGHAE